MNRKHVKKIILAELLVVIITISVFAEQNQHHTTYDTVSSIATQSTELAESIARGEEVYTDFCMQCHMADGKGSGRTFPPLAGSDWLREKRTESIHSVKYGLSGQIKVNGIIYNSAMTSQGLANDEIADVMNYIMNSWGNTQDKMVSEEEVIAVKK